MSVRRGWLIQAWRPAATRWTPGRIAACSVAQDCLKAVQKPLLFGQINGIERFFVPLAGMVLASVPFHVRYYPRNKAAAGADLYCFQRYELHGAFRRIVHCWKAARQKWRTEGRTMPATVSFRDSFGAEPRVAKADVCDRQRRGLYTARSAHCKKRGARHASSRAWFRLDGSGFCHRALDDADNDHDDAAANAA
jgi:hypothetical protein